MKNSSKRSADLAVSEQACVAFKQIKAHDKLVIVHRRVVNVRVTACMRSRQSMSMTCDHGNGRATGEAITAA